MHIGKHLFFQLLDILGRCDLNCLAINIVVTNISAFLPAIVTILIKRSVQKGETYS